MVRKRENAAFTIEPSGLTQKSDFVFLVTSDETHDDSVVFAPLKAVDAADFQVGETSMEQ
jgi:hypothetical protein